MLRCRKIREPSIVADVFQSVTGELHPVLVNRRGRLLWQGSAEPTRSAARSVAETERTARVIRLLLRFRPGLGAPL